MGRRWLVTVLVLATVTLAGQGGGVFAQGYGYDAAQPSAGLVSAMKTTQVHATNAARAETLRDSLWHLGHVVNCLEGAGGKNYDTKNMNPCQGQGTGVIPDLAAARSGQMGAASALDTARKADDLALETLKLTDLAQVKAGATK